MVVALDEKGTHFKGKLGKAVRSSVKSLLVEHGIDREEFVASLDPDLRWFLTEHYLATNWYPLRGSGQMLEALARRLDLDPLEVSRRVGRDVAYASAGRVGRTIVSTFGTPTRVARYLAPMLTQLYDGGDVEAAYSEDTGILSVRRSNWKPHHSLICITLLGSLECLSEHMSGYRLVSAQRCACVCEGADACRLELRFEPC